MKRFPRLGRPEIAAYLYLSLFCIAFVYLIIGERTRNIEQAVSQIRAQQEREVSELRLRIESQFHSVQQGLRTIARLPSVQAVDRHGDNLSSDALTSILEIYFSLSSSLDVSELYIVPANFSPESIDPVTGELEEPIAEFDQFITRAGANSEPIYHGVHLSQGEVWPIFDKVEIHEYRSMREQIDQFKASVPISDLARYDAWPTLMSDELITCDNRFVASAREDDHGKLGMVYSVPFYRSSGELGGMVSAVLLTRTVANMLGDGDYALLNRKHGLSIASPALGPDWAAPGAEADNPPPGFRFSTATPVAIDDLAGGWEIWHGLSEQKVSGNTEMATAHYGALLQLTLISIIWAGAMVIIRLLFARHGQMASRNLELKAHVAERTRDLAVAKAEAERANDAKTQLLASVSHEVRTPLAAIIGAADLMCSESIPTESRKRLKTIRTAGESLLGLINQILNVSSVEAGRIVDHPEIVSIEALVEDVLSLFADAAGQKNLALEAEFQRLPARWFRVNDVSLRQVLMNLVGNAVKFTHAGSVRLRVSGLETADTARADMGRAKLMFEVVDTGPGVSAEARELIFDAFRQESEEVSRRHGGVGLGLAISRKLVEQLGGWLELDSRQGEGSRFFFTIEAEVSAPSRETAGESAYLEHAERAEERAPLSGVRLLLVEDNAEMREVTHDILARAGGVVSVAASGQEALEQIERRAFDVILMDRRMPDMDGEETSRRIRALETQRAAGRAVPIIALTANAFEADKRACLAAGMTAFMSKPFSAGQLVETIAKAAGDAVRGAA